MSNALELNRHAGARFVGAFAHHAIQAHDGAPPAMAIFNHTIAALAARTGANLTACFQPSA
ncbi:hypothetical protein [Paraburkholderia sp. J11-2]|uniref:hypothetical protein n=1 Tax=Paraburkholderia sp. J11-2 TaxID=2805431 RepID=UPI002AB66D7B|nr:hypothetical protein [Paraburkholderia sp. J11-2]